MVCTATIINMRNRAAGRTGLGAVMGSKNLKAIAVRGSLRPTLADPKGVKADTILANHDTCYACVLRCKREVETDDKYQIRRELAAPNTNGKR